MTQPILMDDRKGDTAIKELIISIEMNGIFYFGT